MFLTSEPDIDQNKKCNRRLMNGLSKIFQCSQKPVFYSKRLQNFSGSSFPRARIVLQDLEFGF